VVRQRLLLARARSLVRSSYSGSRAAWRIRGGTARVDVTASVFCVVRERAAQPLCQYYAAAYERMLALFDIETTVEVVSCRGTGADACSLSVPFVAAAAPPAETT
jgi:predicted hydrocarbon binding protein